jgi:hypothetical protein
MVSNRDKFVWGITAPLAAVPEAVLDRRNLARQDEGARCNG